MKAQFKTSIIIVTILLAVVAGLYFKGSATQKHSEKKLLLGTIVQVDVCHKRSRSNDVVEVIGKAWERVKEIDRYMNVYNEKSDVAKINASYMSPVTVREDTYKLISDSKYYSKITNGAFDITVGPLISLWKTAEKNNVLPLNEEIEKVKELVGSNKVRLLENWQVEVLRDEVKIDLGGIAKGYAVDEAARVIEKKGFRDIFIDAGGDILVKGMNCSGDEWRIGIRDPINKANIIEVVNVTDSAITTSGDYEQYIEIKEERWSHIINPNTGYPQKGTVSATVIAPNAKIADVLSTALTILSPQEGVSLIDSLGDGYACVIIPEKGSSFKSKNISKYLKF